MTPILQRARVLVRGVQLVALLGACGGRVGGDGGPNGTSGGSSASNSTWIASTLPVASSVCYGCVVTATPYGTPTVGTSSPGGCYYNGGTTGCATATVTYVTATTLNPAYSCYSSGSYAYCQGPSPFSTSISYSYSYVTGTTVYSTSVTSAPSYCYQNGYYYAQGQTWTCPDGCNECQCLSGQVWATTYACAIVDAGIYDAALGE